MRSTGKRSEASRQVPSPVLLRATHEPLTELPRSHPAPAPPAPHSLGASQSMQKLLPRTVRTACTARAAFWFPSRVCAMEEARGGRSVSRPPGLPPQGRPRANLVLGAAAALQAGEDLGLHALDPQFPLLCR